MSCPDWRGLLAERAGAELEGDFEPTGAWRSAVAHLAGCVRCRMTVLDLDASLLFLAQPPLEVTDDEVDRIKTGVATLLRARRTERAAGAVRRRAARVAAAAAVVSLMILVPTHTARQPPPVPSTAGTRAPDSRPPAARGTGPRDAPAPLIEPLDLPLARIYQLGGEDLSIVMVVDESIDV